MIKNILVLCFFCAAFTSIAFCQDEIEIDSQVMSINPDKEYIIIKAGENEGVKIGDGLVVHRDADRIAEAQVVEVRPDVAAAEILNIEKGKEVKEGDSILIVKKAKKYAAGKKEQVFREPKKSKWTALLGTSSEVRSAAPVETISPGYRAETLKPGRVQVTQESALVRVNIGTDLNTVFSYALMALRENGYSVLFSNRASGLISASRPIELSIIKELWADAHAAIEHRTVVSVEMKDIAEGATELNISSFKEHIQKGKQIKFPITKDSRYYSDLVELASKIKERTGR